MTHRGTFLAAAATSGATGRNPPTLRSSQSHAEHACFHCIAIPGQGRSMQMRSACIATRVYGQGINLRITSISSPPLHLGLHGKRRVSVCCLQLCRSLATGRRGCGHAHAVAGSTPGGTAADAVARPWAAHSRSAQHPPAGCFDGCHCLLQVRGCVLRCDCHPARC